MVTNICKNLETGTVIMNTKFWVVVTTEEEQIGLKRVYGISAVSVLLYCLKQSLKYIEQLVQ